MWGLGRFLVTYCVDAACAIFGRGLTTQLCVLPLRMMTGACSRCWRCCRFDDGDDKCIRSVVAPALGIMFLPSRGEGEHTMLRRVSCTVEYLITACCVCCVVIEAGLNAKHAVGVHGSEIAIS